MFFSKNILSFFVKYPRPGYVKTRLSKYLGKEKAASLYKLCAEELITRISHKEFSKVIFYAPAKAKSKIKNWLKQDLILLPQKGCSLGERLKNAFLEMFAKGAEKVIIIGTDSPLLEARIILKAFKVLDIYDLVLGPSSDGGYYLIGLTLKHKNNENFYFPLFKNIKWQDKDVFSSTLKKAEKLKLKVKALKEYFDIDVAEDLIFLKREIEKIKNLNFEKEDFSYFLNNFKKLNIF